MKIKYSRLLWNAQAIVFKVDGVRLAGPGTRQAGMNTNGLPFLDVIEDNLSAENVLVEEEAAAALVGLGGGGRRAPGKAPCEKNSQRSICA